MSSQVIPGENLDVISTAPETLGLYQFDSGTAKHYFCRQCGIYTHHETARFPGAFRVNLGCVDDVDTFEMPFSVFDGKHLL